MALVEKINSLRQSGMRDSQIINSLREEGFSPMEISDGLSQANIKSAISGEQTSEENAELQPSIMSAAESEQTVGTPESMSAPKYPQAQETPQYAQEQYSAEQYGYSPEQYPQAQMQAEQYGYPAQQEYYQQGIDLETVRDIARQETEEAVRKLREQISSIEKIKTDIKFEIQDMENRVARIESVINELQSAIIRKMGDYGSAISSISQEIKATQNAFSKMINPVLDAKRKPNQDLNPETRQQPPQKANPQAQKRNADKSASFEDYFRG